MADEPDNLVLVMLRRVEDRLRAIEAKVDRLSDDLKEVKVRLRHIEENMAIVHRRIDRIEERVERIEHRLELADPGMPGVRE